MSFISTIFGDANARIINAFRPTVDRINGLEKELEMLSSEALKAKTGEFKKRLAEGESLDGLLPEAFAVVREASKRVSGKRHFDVQLMGGIVLHKGKIAEMKTGEGKTLVATLPAYLNALTGNGVHIVTVNDYLSRRDAVWMGQIYDALGLRVGCLNHDAAYLYDTAHKNAEADQERDLEGGFKVVHEFLRPVFRKEAYDADITYGTNNEFGFDYLRDNLVYHPSQLVQSRLPSINESMKDRGSPIQSAAELGRSHNFAIVDEVDSILIDEARTPLIISAPDAESTKLYGTFARIVPHLTEQDYVIDEKLKTVSITETGIEKVEKQLGIDNIYNEGGVRYVHHLEQALRAHVLFKRDKDYVVNPSADGGEVIIVDEFTGRLMPGRRWSEGLHQAVEAKEGVKVEQESKTLGTITFQNYFRMYQKLAGMTGTARSSAEEFHKVYKLDVIDVPTNKPMIRADVPDRIYKNEAGKFRAVVKEIKERNEKGQPVLVGTVSIEKNEILSSMLEREGIQHTVLNAKNHEREGEIIAQAGRSGGVTVATNMAGRGVDIMLGGHAPGKFKVNEVESDLNSEYEKWQEENRQVLEAGGLHVIGTERHEARRIDDQLRGRAGRQGDPGSSQFFVSTDDELVRVFGGDRLKNIMERLGVGEDDVIENKFISNAIQQAQARIEGHNFDMRKYVLEYDDVVNKHREAVYRLRKSALDSKNNRDLALGYVREQASGIVDLHMASEGDIQFKEMADALKALAPFGDDLESKLQEKSNEELINYVNQEIERLYAAREQEIGLDNMGSLESMVLLRTIDELWIDHISTMEYLRDSVRLRAYGQRDPLVEYKIEGQRLFDQLNESIKSQVANLIFKVSIMREPAKIRVEEKGPLSISAPEATHQETINVGSDGRPAFAKASVGRNDPCPCGAINPATGQIYKYKKCGLINASHHRQS